MARQHNGIRTRDSQPPTEKDDRTIRVLFFTLLNLGIMAGSVKEIWPLHYSHYVGLVDTAVHGDIAAGAIFLGILTISLILAALVAIPIEYAVRKFYSVLGTIVWWFVGPIYRSIFALLGWALRRVGRLYQRVAAVF